MTATTSSRDEDLPRKYYSELFANEVVLLAYYIAAIKIEAGMGERGGFVSGAFKPFPGVTLGDTFMGSAPTAGRLPGMADNTARHSRQSGVPITVIMMNPPWSAGQKSAGDDNPNIDYPLIEQRVRDTYGTSQVEVTGRSGGGTGSGNLYVQAIRWASDRLGHPPEDDGRPRRGVIAMVHPNSLSTGTSFAGMRAALRDEFTSIYVVNLLGDANTSGDVYRREGDKIFGQGSRIGVQITVLVRNPDRNPDEPAVLRYATVPEFSKLDEKFAWLDQLGDVTSDQTEVVEPNPRHDWIKITDDSDYQQLLPVCAVGSRRNRPNTIFDAHASGVKTNCDAYVYSFDREALVARINELIDAYEYARHRVSQGTSIAEATVNDDLETIKWHPALKQALTKNKEIVFDESWDPMRALSALHEDMALLRPETRERDQDHIDAIPGPA